MPKPRVYDLHELKDPEDNPYEGFRSPDKSEPVYDRLVVGANGFRQAFKGGVLVDERTGRPLAQDSGAPAVPPVPPSVPVATRRRPGRPRNASA